MDIEELKELKKRVKQSANQDGTRLPKREMMNDLLDLIDEAIARQSVKSEEVQEAIAFIQGGYGDVWQWSKERRNTIIAALQKYQPWIPCSASMPQDGELVIILFDGKTATAEYDKECHDFNTNIFIVHEDTVTHWMPLPEPPKGE